MRRQFNYRNQSPNNNGYPPRNNGYPSNYYNQYPLPSSQYYQQQNPNNQPPNGYNQIPRKKHIYKKWWFWLLIAIAFIALMAFIFGRPKKKDYSINTLEKNFYYIERQYNNAVIPLNDKKITDKKIIENCSKAKNNIDKKVNLLKLNQSYSDITNDLIKIGENASISLQSLIDQAKGKRARPDMKAANKVYNLTNMFIDKYFKTSKSKKNKTNNFEKNNKSNTNLSSDESTGNEKNKKVDLQFGQTVNLINGNRIIQMQVESVKNVDPNEVMVTDISHNETDKQQFVIVSYKVTAEKGEINLDQFDGSELSIADSTGEIGTQSSNRDNGTPKNLAQGQSITLRIGVGFKNKGNTAIVQFSGNTWSGNIS